MLKLIVFTIMTSLICFHSSAQDEVQTCSDR